MPGRVEQQYKPLGGRTLMLFIMKRGTFSYIILLVIIASFVFSRFVPYEYTGILSNIILTGIVAFVISYLIVVFLGWLEYIHYGVFIKDDGFEVTKGMFSELEVGVPYRFVREVRLERSVADQIFGVSNVVVKILGEVEGLPFSKEHEIILPSINYKMAAEIQESILNKSDACRAKIL
jgi:uncharacterized membrane protein YdbT with pleckstrin-like domain